MSIALWLMSSCSSSYTYLPALTNTCFDSSKNCMEQASFFKRASILLAARRRRFQWRNSFVSRSNYSLLIFVKVFPGIHIYSPRVNATNNIADKRKLNWPVSFLGCHLLLLFSHLSFHESAGNSNNIIGANQVGTHKHTDRQTDARMRTQTCTATMCAHANTGTSLEYVTIVLVLQRWLQLLRRRHR